MCIAFVYLLLYMVCTYKHLLLVHKQSTYTYSKYVQNIDTWDDPVMFKLKKRRAVIFIDLSVTQT